MVSNGSSKGISLAYFICLYEPLAPHFSAMCVPSRCSAIFTPLIAQLYEAPHCSVVLYHPHCSAMCGPLIVQLCVCPLIVQLRVHPPLLIYS